MKKTATITLTPDAGEWSAIRKGCGHGNVVRTVPDTRRGAPTGSPQ